MTEFVTSYAETSISALMLSLIGIVFFKLISRSKLTGPRNSYAAVRATLPKV